MVAGLFCNFEFWFLNFACCWSLVELNIGAVIETARGKENESEFEIKFTPPHPSTISPTPRPGRILKESPLWTRAKVFKRLADYINVLVVARLL